MDIFYILFPEWNESHTSESSCTTNLQLCTHRIML
uniref:Uncharacterized protein n=1 Tax=Arundo donax TaxID=35708 RepID=A0A0A8YF72_ARUDO